MLKTIDYYSRIIYNDRTRTLGLFVILGVLYVVASRPVLDFNYTHWLFNFEHEFLKRALIGELFRLSGIKPTFLVVNIAAYLVTVITAFTLLYVFLKPLVKEGNPQNHWLILFFILAASHSASVQHFVFDNGRFDHFLVLITLFLMYAVKEFPRIWALIVFLVFNLVALLIHEAHFFMFLPLICAWWIYCDRGGTGFNVIRIISLAVLVFATWAISYYGRVYTMPYDVFIGLLQQEFGEMATLASLAVLYRGFSGNIEYNAYWLFTDRILFNFVIFSFIISPTYVLFHRINKALYCVYTDTSEKIVFVVLMLSCLAPLGLLLFGFDVFRWFAISLTNMMIVYSLLSSNYEMRKNLIECLKSNVFLILIIISLSLIFGALGNSWSFRWVFSIWESLGFEVV